MPTPLRTDLCSATRPPLKGYSTGMSQPPKFTNFAPRRRCNAFSGVFRRIAFAGEITESIPFARANLDGSTRPGCRQNKAFPAVRQWARVSKEGNLSGLRLRRRAGTRLAKFALALRQWLFVPLLLVAQPSGRAGRKAIGEAPTRISRGACQLFVGAANPKDSLLLKRAPIGAPPGTPYFDGNRVACYHPNLPEQTEWTP